MSALGNCKCFRRRLEAEYLLLGLTSQPSPSSIDPSHPLPTPLLRRSDGNKLAPPSPAAQEKEEEGDEVNEHRPRRKGERIFPCVAAGGIVTVFPSCGCKTRRGIDFPSCGCAAAACCGDGISMTTPAFTSKRAGAKSEYQRPLSCRRAASVVMNPPPPPEK